jgi:hypothetical protein
LVRFDPIPFDSSIEELGIQLRFFKDRKIWLAKYGDAKLINDPRSLETVLYRKSLWPAMAGKFSEGATLRVVRNVEGAAAAGLTNRTNGHRQWRLMRDVRPEDLETIRRIVP